VKINAQNHLNTFQDVTENETFFFSQKNLSLPDLKCMQHSSICHKPVYIIVKIKQTVKIFSSSLLHVLKCGYKYAF